MQANSSIDLIAAHSILSESRLPKIVTPLRYHLELQPNIIEGNFTGTVKINITAHDLTNEIVLHAHQDLQIPKETIQLIQYSFESQKPPIELKVNEIERVAKKSLLKILLEKPLQASTKCQLTIKFSGKLYNDTSEALFRSSYKDGATGELKWYLASYFRPNLARRVFPCFDEPSFKAYFVLKIARMETMTALSNMQLASTEPM